MQSLARSLANTQPVLNDAAAIVTFGARALGLARSTLPLPAENITAGLADPNDIERAALRAVQGDENPSLLDTIGSNTPNTALVNALDANGQAALLRTPGALDRQSGLFREPASTLESGFFPSPRDAVDSALLQPLTSDALEPGFPPAPGPLESGFFRSPSAGNGAVLTPLVGGELESTFPRAVAQDVLESAFPRAQNPLAEAAQNDLLESAFPLAQNPLAQGARNDVRESPFPLAQNPLAQAAQNGVLESPFPLAQNPLAQAAQASIFQAPNALAQGAQNDLFEAPPPLIQAAEENSVFRSPSPLAQAAQNPLAQVAQNDLFEAPLPLQQAAQNPLAQAAQQSVFQRPAVDTLQEATRATTQNAQTLFTGAPFVQNAASLFPRAVNNTLRPVQAATAPDAVQPLGPDTLESTFPRGPAETDSATLRSPLAPNSDSPFARSPAANSETAFPRAPVANNTEPGLIRTPASEAAEIGLADAATTARAAAAERSAQQVEELSAQQQREVQTLARNDREVRSDQLAQRAAAGGYADGVTVRYQIGPDGRRYAVDSQVSFDVTPVPGDPAATLRKMEVVSRAANSASNPSATDRSAAAEAEQLMRQARAQLAAERYSEASSLFGRE